MIVTAPEGFLTEVDSGVLTITLNRPDSANAMAGRHMAALAELLRVADQRPEIRSVLITGAGRTFCAGADLDDLKSNQATETTAAAWRHKGRHGAMAMTTALANLEKPVVAGVNGGVAGGGLGLVLFADIVVVASTAKLSFAFAKRGLGPDCGVSWMLPRVVGFRAAQRICLRGETLTAAEACQMGLVTEVTDPERLLKVARERARELGDGAGVAQGLTKRLLLDAQTSTLTDALNAEFTAQALCLTSEDAREGTLSFLEKRPPRFTGR